MATLPLLLCSLPFPHLRQELGYLVGGYAFDVGGDGPVVAVGVGYAGEAGDLSGAWAYPVTQVGVGARNWQVGPGARGRWWSRVPRGEVRASAKATYQAS